jgi:rhodanese-related sulfurtransferase
MGPLVPDIISPEMNLIVGLLLGIAFGFVLEQAGFSSCRKLTGLFYGTDFTVLRVFFTAGVTAMSGVLILNHFGLIDMEIVYINPTFLQSAILGGAIMGLGFILGGYCPGTSICGAAVGRIDGMVFVLGGFFGIFLFGEMYPHILSIYTSGSYGDLLVSQSLGISQGQFALLLIAVAVAAFVATTWIEKRVNPASESFRFPRRAHRWAALGVLVLGLILAAMPDRKAALLGKAADPAYQRAHPVARVTADELAFHILDGDRQFLPVDVRDAAEFAKTSLPGAVNIQPATMFGKEWRDVLFQKQNREVFFAQDEAAAVRAATLAQVLGYRNIAVLEGGLDGFNHTILQASAPAEGLSDVDQGIYRFRAHAAVEIASLIKQRGGVKPVRRIKKVQGGCGS